MQIKSIFHSLKHSKILLKRPRIFPRLIRGIIGTIIFKRDSLRIVEFVINSECDSKCRMCYATKYVDLADIPLTLTEINNFWIQCEKLGAFIAAVEGGEPTLRKDFDEVIKALNPWKNIVVLVSNSLGLTREKLIHFKKIGVSILHLSLDGTTPEENDDVRGYDGHFNKVMDAVKICKEIGLEVYFSSVLSRSNKDKYERIVNLAKELEIGVSGALLVSEGRSEKERDDRLTSKDWDWLQDFIRKYDHILRFDWNTNLSGRCECPAGREKISISLYGDIMACVCNHLSFGNIRKESVKKILHRMRNFSFFKERNKFCLVGFDTKYRHLYMDSVKNKDFLPISILRHPVKKAKLREDGTIIE